MDKQVKEYVKKVEERLVAMVEEVGEAKQEALRAHQALADKEAELQKYKDMLGEGQQAHQQDIGEMSDYQQTNAILIEALQEIADGRGKYAKIAQKALGG